MAPLWYMAKTKTKSPDWMTVKVTRAAYDQAQKLLHAVSKNGWGLFQINREDPPTLGALFEEGLNALARTTAVES